MDGVSAKVAKEVAVFFKHCDVHASMGEEVTEDDPSGTAAYDAACRLSYLLILHGELTQDAPFWMRASCQQRLDLFVS